MTAHTERGFRIYDRFRDSYSSGVDVIESSAAMIEGEFRGPWVWVFIEGGAVTDNRGAAHLEYEQAERLRNALNVFLVENEPYRKENHEEATAP